MARKASSVDTESQHHAFAGMARELGCDESETAFNAKLEKVARAAVPRKPAARVKVTKPQEAAKQPTVAEDAPSPKKKTRFILPGA